MRCDAFDTHAVTSFASFFFFLQNRYNIKALPTLTCEQYFSENNLHLLRSSQTQLLPTLTFCHHQSHTSSTRLCILGRRIQVDQDWKVKRLCSCRRLIVSEEIFIDKRIKSFPCFIIHISTIQPVLTWHETTTNLFKPAESIFSSLLNGLNWWNSLQTIVPVEKDRLLAHKSNFSTCTKNLIWVAVRWIQGKYFFETEPSLRVFRIPNRSHPQCFFTWVRILSTFLLSALCFRYSFQYVLSHPRNWKYLHNF